jgi:hypothetical protein
MKTKQNTEVEELKDIQRCKRRRMYKNLSTEELLTELITSAYVDGYTDMGRDSQDTKELEIEILERIQMLNSKIATQLSEIHDHCISRGLYGLH